MNGLLWLLQAVLALLYLTGGSYKFFQVDELANQMIPFSRGTWRALGVFEMLGGLLVIVPAVLNRMSLSALAAAALAIETLVLAALYSRYSVEFAVTNPMVWALGMGLLAAVVAYGRSRR